MKRNLLQNVKTVPHYIGTAIDRQGFLSAVLGASITAAGVLTLTITHCDTATGTFTAPTDTMIAPKEKPTLDAQGNIVPGVYNINAEAGLLNIDIDLVGLKRFVTIAISGTASVGASYAYVLGDAEYQPV